MQLPDICNARGTPTCSCGLEMVFRGRDGDYLKYSCPQAVGKGVCSDLSPCTRPAYGYVLKLPIKDDVRRHPPIPRETKKWEKVIRSANIPVLLVKAAFCKMPDRDLPSQK